MSIQIVRNYCSLFMKEGKEVQEFSKLLRCFRNLRAAIKRKRPLTFVLQSPPLPDNARFHYARRTQQKIGIFSWDAFPHPSYFSDRAPSDFHLFPTLKIHLGNKHFHTVK